MAPLFVAASAGIILPLGLVHLLLTFSGDKLYPRDSELRARLTRVSPVLTNETTMWNCWIGFNASHGAGLIVFSAVYGYLALSNSTFLFRSWYLLLLGLLQLVGYTILARLYWFSVPFRALLLATALYAIALALHAVGLT
jgi:hypothetical protein